MSPGGIMLNSARSRPELPPSSDVATTATRRSRVASLRAVREEHRAQPAQDVREPGAAADRHDARARARTEARVEAETAAARAWPGITGSCPPSADAPDGRVRRVVDRRENSRTARR